MLVTLTRIIFPSGTCLTLISVEQCVTMAGYASAWCSVGSADPNPWIQVDFITKVYITAVITQGRGDYDQWVTEYQVAYSSDGQDWQHVTNKNGTNRTVSKLLNSQTLSGNSFTSQNNYESIRCWNVIITDSVGVGGYHALVIENNISDDW